MSGVWRRGRTSSTSSSTSCSFSPTGAIRRPPPFLAPYAGSVLSAGLRHGTERGRLGRARLSGAGRGDRWDLTRWGEGGRRARREGAVAGRPTAPAARQAGGRSPDSPGLLQGGLHWRFFSVISGTRNPFASFFGDIRHSQSVRLQSQLVTVTHDVISGWVAIGHGAIAAGHGDARRDTRHLSERRKRSHEGGHWGSWEVTEQSWLGRNRSRCNRSWPR